MRPTPHIVNVKVLNGVCGGEEAKFSMPVRAASPEQYFLADLDKLCQEHAGEALSGLQWLVALSKLRYQRLGCDVRMARHVLAEGPVAPDGSAELLLCTIPVKPPSEMEKGTVRLTGLAPAQVECGLAEPTRLQISTSLLDRSHSYSVAFTHQEVLVTYMAGATVGPDCRGVELAVPRQMLAMSSTGAAHGGLYDVYLVVDRRVRSQNRKALSVCSGDEISTTTTSTAQDFAFVPLGRK